MRTWPWRTMHLSVRAVDDAVGRIFQRNRQHSPHEQQHDRPKRHISDIFAVFGRWHKLRGLKLELPLISAPPPHNQARRCAALDRMRVYRPARPPAGAMTPPVTVPLSTPPTWSTKVMEFAVDMSRLLLTVPRSGLDGTLRHQLWRRLLF
ncbi:hypothetical protein BC567DRAFT_228597 [Phyllosticta citribraziliensis]